MNIILASEVIHPGGAETFILRLAQALYGKKHNVVVFVFYNDFLNRELCKLLAPDVTIVHGDIPLNSIVKKIDGLLFRLKIDFSLRNMFIRKTLRKLIGSQKTDVIHSHLLKVDRLCLEVAGEYKIPVVNTIHGDYLQFFEKTKKNAPIPLLNYLTKAPANLRKLAKVVCISDKQLAFFNTQFPAETAGKLSKIYNGYTSKVKEPADKLRIRLSIQQTDFVFGMVSRGIPDKGWQVAIDAFLQLDRPHTRLVLVGSGDYISSLQTRYKDNKNIHFTGHSDNPVDWINIFNVGLLPTTYPSESLPTVVIEYLYCGLPVIASDAGEIMNMTGQSAQPAGQIIPVRNGKVDSGECAAAMQRYMDDNNLYKLHRQNSLTCYQMFNMDKCVDAYTAIYNEARNKEA